MKLGQMCHCDNLETNYFLHVSGWPGFQVAGESGMSKAKRALHNKQGIAETAKTNGPTGDNMCIQMI